MLVPGLLLLLLLALLPLARGSVCEPRHFGSDSVVCVCSALTCDFPGVIQAPDAPFFTSVTSTRDGLRFHVETDLLASEQSDANVKVMVNHDLQYQTMVGFGGAFTDATGINVNTLPEDAQDQLLKSYFSPEGLEYNLCRIPIAGSDFSARPYSYDDVEGDIELKHFNLTEEDYMYKLPLIHRAQELAEKDLLLFGSPWSPPAWMKENGMFNGSGGLLKEMWQPWSDYFVKFVEAYEAEGVPIWGLTTQNEPLTGFDDWYWNTCAWSAEDQRDWIKTNLGPTLEDANLRRLKLMIVDHNRDTLPWYPSTILEDEESRQYVDGIALHWYADDWAQPSLMDEIHSLFPDKFLLYTESCEGWDAAPDQRVVLGAWDRAESYASNIIEDTNHWATGWVDWNMALDTAGGPNWANNFVDSPIIIDRSTGEFYKQPTFYALGHFSKFVSPGAVRVYSSVAGSSMFQAAAFRNPDNTTALVLLNVEETPESVLVDTGRDGDYVNFDMPAKAIITFLYQSPAAAA
ncbi:putative glucosylceramidase 4 [Procambarus clarkii]|uniref:putative glucosylceramidase 4 n=1 Tax=Procambarus clarkii TaxID=6728 RepID=UPI003743F401